MTRPGALFLAAARIETGDEARLFLRLGAGGVWRRMSLQEKIADLDVSPKRVAELVTASARWRAARRASRWKTPRRAYSEQRSLARYARGSMRSARAGTAVTGCPQLRHDRDGDEV